MLSSSSSALFEDFSYTSDGATLVCLNIDSTSIDSHVDIKYKDLWGVSTIEKLMVHLNDSKVLITAYTPNMSNLLGLYYGVYGGVFDIVNQANNMPYIEFEADTDLTDKAGKKIIKAGRLNRFTGDIHIGHIYGPCKKIERIF